MTEYKQDNSSSVNLAEVRERVANCIGYHFKNTALMLEALTHKSYFNEKPTDWSHNERLEFLGDAVLDLVISDRFMNMLEAWPEGTLTRFRASLVNEENLAELARHLDIGPLLLLGKGEEKNNGREKASILSDCLEAIVGAVFLDSDFYVCRDVTLSWFEPMIAQVVKGEGMADAKTQLQQELQANNCMPVYKTVGIAGPDHDRTYEVEISVDGKILARGVGKSKKDAEKQAAQNSLEMLKEEQ